MGMFDEFQLHKPIKCPKCNTKLKDDVQSKKFEQLMDYYRVFDYVNYDKNILEETYYCSNCKKIFDVYLAFKDGIYLGCYETKEEASKTDINLMKLYALQNEKLKDYRELIAHCKIYLEQIKEFHFENVDKNSKLSLFYFGKLDYDIKQNLNNIIEVINNQRKKIDGNDYDN